MRILLLLIFIGIFNQFIGQINPVHRKYTTDEGLGSNTIYSFYQMKNGRMVVGHDVGISFFDGNRFINPEYKVSSRSVYQSVSLNNNELLSINFQGKSFKIIDDKVNSFDTSIILKKILSHQEELYLVTPKELFILEENLELKSLYNYKDLLDIFYSGIVYDNKILLAGLKDSLNYIAEFQLNDFELISYKEIDFSPDFFVINGELLFLDHHSNTVFKKDDLSYTMVHQMPIHDKIHFIYSIKNKKILVGTQEGLFVYDENWKLEHHFFKGIPISKAFQDIEENIWLGTLNDGLLIIDNIDFLEFLMSTNLEKNTTISNSIKTKNNIILGTFKGQLICLDESAQILWIKDLNYNSEIQALFFEEHKNTLFFYCKNLYEIAIADGEIINEYFVTSTKSIDIQNELIACGTSLGIALSSNDFISTDTDLWIRNLYFHGEEDLILETQLGIKFWNKKKGIHTSLNHSRNLEPENLTFWKGNYIVKFGDSLYQILNEKLIPFEWQPQSIYKLKSTDEFLYVSHLKGGFSCYDGANSVNYHSESGIHNFKINKVLYLNEKWFLISDKSVRIIPFNKRKVEVSPKLFISKIEGSFVRDKNRWISEYENNIFKVVCQIYPNVSDFGESQVYYRIKGVRNDWVKCSNSSEGFKMTIERLPFGSYQLEIKGINISGKSSEILSYTLVINKPFYLTWWFICFVLIALTSSVFLIIKQREKLLKKKNLEKLKKEKLKIQALKSELAAIRSQMNPHLIFNSLSSIQTKILTNKSKEAYEHLVIFTKLLRQALDYSQREYITLAEELDFLKHYINLEFLRKDASFSWNLELDENIQLENHWIPSLILQPFVENAIIHGLMHSTGDKILTINVKRFEVNGFEVSIIDNGIGREASKELNKERLKEHKSFAMKAIQQRIEIINLSGKLNLALEIVDLHKGTKVILKVTDKIIPS